MDLVPPVYWATRSWRERRDSNHTGPGLSRLPLAVGLCSRRPFRCCPGFSGLRGRRLRWWSNGRVNWQPAEESNPDRELQRLPSCR